jgi:hypothetical protein
MDTRRRKRPRPKGTGGAKTLREIALYKFKSGRYEGCSYGSVVLGDPGMARFMAEKGGGEHMQRIFSRLLNHSHELNGIVVPVRIRDAGAARARSGAAAGGFTAGKYKGQTFEAVMEEDPSYVRWAAENWNDVSVRARLLQVLAEST